MRHDDPLIERDAQLTALSGAVARLVAGNGSMVGIEAPAGLGKTALLDRASAEATAAGCVVRRAAPGPLERHFPYGVIRALFEAPLRETPPVERARLVDGVAARAGALLLDGDAGDGAASMFIAHSLLWLGAGLAERAPLVLVVDDAQWADRDSLEALTYLAGRLADVPVLLIVAARTDDPDADAALLGLLGQRPSGTMLRLLPLSCDGAERLIRRLVPDAPTDACRRYHVAARGNPWLLGELGRQLAADGTPGDDTTRAERPDGELAREVVRRRLLGVPPPARALASALAILGDGMPPSVLAAVSGLAVREIGPARDALTAAGLLAPGADGFAHRLIATAVAEELAPSERARLHRVAVDALDAAGADLTFVAGHALRSPAQADADISALLVRAASDAWRRGAPHATATYLQRALAEGAPGDNRGQMLVQLAIVAFDAGLPDSQARLQDALGAVTDPDQRLEMLTRLAALNNVDVDDDALSERLWRELAEVPEPASPLMLETARLDALLMLPKRLGERVERAAAVNLSGDPDPLLRRVVLAHRAWLAVETGEPDAATCAALAVEALDGGLLLAQARQRPAYHHCVRALVLTDRIDDARAAISAMRADAEERSSMRLRARAAWNAADVAFRTGDVTTAERAAREAAELAGENISMVTGAPLRLLVCALAERGAFAEARELLATRSRRSELGSHPWDIAPLYARARLGLAEGDFEGAYADAVRAGALRDAQGRTNPTWTPWRSTAALALAHLGRRQEAAALADDELVLAERFGAPRAIIVALHARIVSAPHGPQRLALCEAALAVAETPRLELARVRLELGATLAWLGRRTEAREPLRRALADADSGGAVLVAERARRELVASGVRPRRTQLDGPNALTPRQQQVCGLAAAGAPNRVIAQQLFLSVKTVEAHLAAGYEKLGVRTRDELAEALATSSVAES